MKYFASGLTALLFIFSFSCQSPSTTADIAVEWEHVTNFTGEPNVFESKFTLIHNGGVDLNGKNWTLFFNINPRPMVSTPVPQPATVEHINGDWYKMVPKEDFSLKEGESVEVIYRGTEAIIKETDGPLGLYFVYYDANGNEEQIVEVSDYTLHPFTKPEQIHRNDEDYDPIPTSSYLYKTNEKLSVLPKEKLDLIVPTPVSTQKLEGTLTLDKDFTIFYQPSLEKEAKFLKEKLLKDTGLDLPLSTEAATGKAVVLQHDQLTVNGNNSEAYYLTIDPAGISIVGSDAAGVFYGIQSLRALIPMDNLSSKSGDITLRCKKISDAPRFGFRSLHLDIGRNFQTKETILRMLDVAAYYKINHFLFYVTEDEGWRLEIKDLPELTEVGGARKHTTSFKTSVVHPAYGSGPYANDPDKNGSGYYTREDFIEILKYAQERHITIIPEVNFPGHARAAIKAMEARYDRADGSW